MAFLELLEKNRSPFMDRIVLWITELGGEAFLIVFGLIVLWCVNKGLGRYMLSVGIIGTVMSQWLKILCRVPRPWVLKEGFTIVEAAREGAGGYSFPSGHSQSAAAVFGCLALWYKKRAAVIACALLTALVLFSRMYLGVHTPWDVAVGCLLSLALAVLLRPLFSAGSPTRTRAALLICLACSAAFALYMSLCSFGADTDKDNLNEAAKNAWLLLGGSAGICLAFEIDERFVRYDTRAAWYVQIVKCVLGAGLVFLLRMALKKPLLSLFGGHPAADAVRYFILCLFGAGVWPMSFKFLRRMEKGADKAEPPRVRETRA